MDVALTKGYPICKKKITREAQRLEPAISTFSWLTHSLFERTVQQCYMGKITERLTDRGSSSDDDGGITLLGPAGDSLRWGSAAAVSAVLTLKVVPMQSGRRDILTATGAAIVLFAPIWLAVGAGDMLGMRLCTDGQMGIVATGLAGLLQLLVLVFVLKGLLRTMVALSRDDELADPVLSMAAGVIPAVIGSVLTVGGSSLLACLFP